MKFAKELEDDLVPEWRVKYFNYKQGKKRVKAASRAYRNLYRSPSLRRPSLHGTRSDSRLPYTFYDFARRNEQDAHSQIGQQLGERGTQDVSRPRLNEDVRRHSVTMFAQSPPVLMPGTQPLGPSGNALPGQPESPEMMERMPLHENQERGTDGRPRRYGSIPRPPETSSNQSAGLPRLELPDPALDPDKRKSTASLGVLTPQQSGSTSSKQSPDNSQLESRPKSLQKSATFTAGIAKEPHSKKSGDRFSQSRFKRIFKSQPLESPGIPAVQTDAIREFDAKQVDFDKFLNKELKKVEKFYKSKEDEATQRLDVLREQLHEMRDRVQQAKAKGIPLDGGGLIDHIHPSTTTSELGKKHAAHKVIIPGILKPLNDMLRTERTYGKRTNAMQKLGSPTGPDAQQPANGNASDYVRKSKDEEHVPYRSARRRLKLAMQEFYRGLELLKSYALLNRTAFRKINKKYDKAVNARPTLQYMISHVNKAHFVQSTIIEAHLVAIEDLYARYFERGNHKVAVNKLRSRLRTGDQSAVSFRNGLYLAAGAGLGIAGLVNAGRFLFSDDPVLTMQTSYLLQLYGGYFLGLLLFMIFVIDCRIWTKARVNYVFVFEFDTRHVLDFRQLAEIPCFFLFLNGLFIWLNFEFESAHPMYLYWPVILIGLTLVIICFPAKVLYYHSRKWFGFSNWRLLLAGIYPVEFRDFFFGDMYCSETYAMSQIELFFCLYAHKWNNPSQCNSNHSMLMGFFTALPAVWRANQCLRRYYDTRAWFPHLANFGKYMFNILYYMTLSLYRLDINHERRAVFIVFAAVNGIYSSIWDVFMDWSLGDPWARHPFLRKNLAYRKIWIYYAAIVADVVLRHQWIVYAIFTSDLQHSAFASFIVGLAEVLRRGMWSLFRVENEHCNNVQKFRASRDVPLPYTLPRHSSLSDSARDTTFPNDTDDSADERYISNTPASPTAAGSGSGTAVDLERTRTETSRSSGASLRQRISASTPGLRALQRVGSMIAAAHTQDFQKKKRSELTGTSPEDENMASSSDDDDDDGDDVDHKDQIDEDEFKATSPTGRVVTRDYQPRSEHSGASPQTNVLQQSDVNSVRSYGTQSNTRNNGVGSGSTQGRGARGASASLRLPPERPRYRHRQSRLSDMDVDADAADAADAEEIAEVRDRVNRARSPDT